jgi:hypothetical protein
MSRYITYLGFGGVAAAVMISTVEIPEGVDHWTVSDQAWPIVPTVFGLTVIKPAGGDQLFATLVDGTTTQDGFEVWLNGVTGPGYKLRFGYLL